MSCSASSRRRFVKTFALGTAFSTVLGKPWLASVLADLIPGPPSAIATFKIRISDYPALADPFGSVRVGVNPVRAEEEPFPDGDFWPLLINRAEDGGFYVLDSECRHASCVVPVYDVCDGAIHCPCHGSRYDLDGSVLNGPTQFPLRRYEFEFDGVDILTIHVPGLGFGVNASVLPAGLTGRLQLCFDTHNGITYQLNFRARAQDAWEVVPFALAPDVPTSEGSLIAEGGPATIYVDRTSTVGFYAVAMILAEV